MKSKKTSSRSSTSGRSSSKSSCSTTKPSRKSVTTPAQKFRQQSATKSRSFNLKNSAPKPKQSTHKIPNAIMSKAYNNSKSNNVKKDIIGHAHSSGNIMYSSNNKNHSKMERDLANSKGGNGSGGSNNNYKQSSVSQKGGSMETSLKKLREVQTSAASTQVLRTIRNSGDGFNAVVAGLDKRTFNKPSEKQQINIARKNIKLL
ncbi:hypothetical protein ABK040_011496 [Willaertia magna]